MKLKAETTKLIVQTCKAVLSDLNADIKKSSASQSKGKNKPKSGTIKFKSTYSNPRGHCRPREIALKLKMDNTDCLELLIEKGYYSKESTLSRPRPTKKGEKFFAGATRETLKSGKRTLKLRKGKAHSNDVLLINHAELIKSLKVA